MTETTPIHPRMTPIVVQRPAAMQALVALSGAAAADGELPRTTALLVQLRASQINGCSYCAQMHAGELREAGVADEAIWTVAAWREAPHFSDAERSALELCESLTRIADGDGVPDRVWDEAARHHDEATLASLVLEIVAINAWNRLNVATRVVPARPAG